MTKANDAKGTNGPATPAKVLSPGELADELWSLADDAVPYSVETDVKDAQAALEQAKAKLVWYGERKLRVMRAKSVEEARAILNENPADENLKKLCGRCPQLKPLQAAGGTDVQIVEALQAKWPQYENGDKVPRATTGYHRNRNDLKAWVDPDKKPNGAPHLAGQKLVDAVRRVMNIAKPAAPKPPPAKKKPGGAAAKKGGGGKPAAAKAPAPATSADDDEGERDLEEVETVKIPTPEGASLSVYVGRVKGAKRFPWRAGCYGVLSKVDNRAKSVPLRSDGEAFSGREMAVRVTTQQRLRAWLDDLAGEAWKMSERKVLQDTINALVDFLRDDPAADTSGRVKKAAAAAAKKPPAAKPKGGVPFRKQTWGQWAATLRGINDGVDLSPALPSQSTHTVKERFFLEQFRLGQSPSWARDAWKRQEAAAASQTASPAGSDGAEAELREHHGRPSARARRPRAKKAAEPEAAPLPSVEALDHPQTPMEYPDDEPDEPADEASPDAACRMCGCTEDDCRQCVAKTGGPCRWVDDPILMGNLCSACKPAEYGRRVVGPAVGMSPGEDGDELAGVIVGRTEFNHKPAWQVRLDNGQLEAVYVVGADVGEQTLADAEASAAADDPNVNGQGVFVSGVRQIVVAGAAKGDPASIVIRVARGADGRYRTGHGLVFKGGFLDADADVPVKLSSLALESEPYAVRARANILINVIKAAPGERGAVWSPAQKTAYNAAIKQLETFIAHNPAARLPGKQQAKAG